MEPVFLIQNGGKASALSVSCFSDSFLAFLSRLLKDSTTLQSLQRPQASPGKCVRYFEPPALPTSLEVDPPPRQILFIPDCKFHLLFVPLRESARSLPPTPCHSPFTRRNVTADYILSTTTLPSPLPFFPSFFFLHFHLD